MLFCLTTSITPGGLSENKATQYPHELGLGFKKRGGRISPIMS